MSRHTKPLPPTGSPPDKKAKTDETVPGQITPDTKHDDGQKKDLVSPPELPNLAAGYQAPVAASKPIANAAGAPSDEFFEQFGGFIKQGASKPKNEDDDFTLSALGLKKESSTPKIKPHYTWKDSLLQAAVVPGAPIVQGVSSTFIVFKYGDAREPKKGCYHEKIMNDELLAGTKWVTDLEIQKLDGEYDVLFMNGEEVKNRQKYPVRLFAIEVEQTPKHEVVLKLLQRIASQINKNTKLLGRVYVVEDDLYFTKEREAVWSEIVGANNALGKMVSVIGRPTGEPTYWSENKNIIHTFFRSGTFSINLARFVGAPNEEIDDPSQLQAPLPGDNEGKPKADDTKEDEHEDEHDTLQDELKLAGKSNK